jgi:hypothetical protein
MAFEFWLSRSAVPHLVQDVRKGAARMPDVVQLLEVHSARAAKALVEAS